MFGLPDEVTACLFDMDGVVTQTAVVHAAAWKDPSRGAVFEDALAGVDAGRAGHFGFVVGVDRVGQEGELKEHGAGVVVKDLADLPDEGGQADKGAP